MLDQNQQQYIHLSQLSKAFGYTRDHLAWLCRKGEIHAKKIGRFWMTTHDEVSRYQKQIELMQTERWLEMSVKQSLKSHRDSDKFFSTHGKVFGYGIYHAFKSFEIAGKILFLYPLTGIFFAVHFLIKIIYAVFNSPLSTFKDMQLTFLKYASFLARPVSELYDNHKEKYSLIGLSRAVAMTRTIAHVSMVVLSVGFWSFTSFTMFGVSPVNVQSEVVRTASRVATLVATRVGNNDYSKMLRETIPAKRSILVNDYLAAGLGILPYQHTEGMVAGVMTSSPTDLTLDLYPKSDQALDEIKNFIESYRDEIKLYSRELLWSAQVWQKSGDYFIDQIRTVQNIYIYSQGFFTGNQANTPSTMHRPNDLH